MASYGTAFRAGLLYEFDDRCHYCGEPRPETLDHIVPLSAGGPGARWNLAPACGPCNRLKSSLRAVCPCSRCIQAEVLFSAYEVLPVTRRERKRARKIPGKVVVPPSTVEEWRLARMAHCSHVARAGEIDCVKCGALIAQTG